MQEKTEELRDIFVDVTNEESVTESQEETPGSLTDRGAVEERLESVITSMRERYDFTTDLDDEVLSTVVREFYDGADDDAIASAVDVSPATVFRARMDLHLLREADEDAPFDLTELRRLVEDDASTADLADRFDLDEETARRYRRIVETRRRATAANDRYRDEFDAILADSELSSHLTEDVKEDGLDDATDGMETDVSF